MYLLLERWERKKTGDGDAWSYGYGIEENEVKEADMEGEGAMQVRESGN